MNKQELAFFDNEQENVYNPRQSDATVVTNRQIEQDGTYEFLTPEQSMLQGEKLIPKSRFSQKSNNSWRWKVVLAIICFLLIATGLIISAIPPQFTDPGPMPMPRQHGPAPHHHTFKFNVSPHPKIVLHDIDSNVHITAGDNNTVIVSESVINPKYRNYGSQDWSGDIQAKLTDNEIIIAKLPTREDFRDYSEQNVGIIVPALADIEMRNITGDINITDVSGRIQASTEYGNITLNSVALNEVSLLQTLNGNIRFNGSLDQLGTYIMATANGSLDISLPSDTSFHLQVENPYLSVNNAFQQNMVGNAPQPILDISATEEIIIRQY